MGNYASTSTETFLPSDAFFLSEATRTGALDIVRLFLKKNPALVYATSSTDGSTPWHVATSVGHELVLRVLIDTTRANAVSNNFSPLSKVINKQNAKGQTPLMLACGGGYSVCVRLLLESGAHLLVADVTGRSALHYAALHNGADGRGNDCVELLLAHMQEQLVKQGPVAAPPSVHANVIRKFADATDMYGRTALHYAAWSGNGRSVHALWAVGADICARTDTDCYDSELPCNTGTTPLHFAAMRGNQNVVVLLLAAWHRMVTRPKAPLPRPAYARTLLTSLRAAAGACGGNGRDGGAAAEPEQQPGSGGAEQTPPPPPPPPPQQQQQRGKAQQEPAAAAAARADKAAEQADDGTRAASAAAAAAAAAAGGNDDHVHPPDQEEGQAQGRQQATASGPGSEAAAAEGAAGPAGSDAGRDGAERAGAEGAGDAGGTGDGSRRGSGAGAEAVADSAALLAELARPPSPRPPAEDPRLMVDAYGMTPYSIACKRRQEHGKMLIELLDPSTDFTAGEDDERDDGDQAAGGGGVGTRRAYARDGTLPKRRFTGDGGGEEEDGEEEDGDSDSEAGAAGPLLLWEGVELIQGLAAEPDAYFKLQATAPLLQLQQRDDLTVAAAAAAGGGGARASLISMVGGRSSSSGASGSFGLGLGCFGGHGGGRPGRMSALNEETVPDCFLCPLTCQVFRDPVVAADGVTYEREAIERHLKIVPTSPVTKQRLPSTQVYANNALKRAIEFWTTRTAAESQHSGTGLVGRR